MEYLLALDIGTTNAKAVAFDRNGGLLAKQSQSYPILTPGPDFQEQHPIAIAEAVEHCIQTLVAAIGIRPLGLSFSSAMHSLIVLDAQHQLLTNSIIWADGRSYEQAKALKNSADGAAIYHQTGTPIHPMSPLCKIVWLREREPSVFQRATKFISIKEFLLFRWFGTFVIDESIASATGLFDIYDRTWYQPALMYAGITKHQLSQVVPTTYVLRGMNPVTAVTLGLSEDVPIVIGGSDGCLANLGEQVLSPKEAALSIGTSGAIRITSPQPLRDEAQRLFNYILDDKHYIVGGATNNGGIVHEWINQLLPQTLRLQTLETVEIGAEGLFFLPYLLGERAPIWDSHARGAFIGLNTQHHAAHLYQATLEGIAYNLWDIFSAVQSYTLPIERIYANGGFMKNAMAVQVLTDVFGIPISLQKHEEGAALGAAWLGWKALSKLEDWSALPQPEIKKTHYPNPDNHQKYQNLFKVWKPIYSALQPTFHALGKVPSATK